MAGRNDVVDAKAPRQNPMVEGKRKGGGGGVREDVSLERVGGDGLGGLSVKRKTS